MVQYCSPSLSTSVSHPTKRASSGGGTNNVCLPGGPWLLGWYASAAPPHAGCGCSAPPHAGCGCGAPPHAGCGAPGRRPDPGVLHGPPRGAGAPHLGARCAIVTVTVGRPSEAGTSSAP
eukprot:977713-Prymnesium_polylepis.1